MLTVNELMTVNPQVVTPTTPLRNVVEAMRVEGFRQLPVVSYGKLVGIITDRDVRLAVGSPHVAELNGDSELADRLRVENCMTKEPVTVTPDTPIYRAADLLSAYKIGALPVVDGDKLVGIITVTDILNYVARFQKPARVESV